jgi:two-component system cell cycle sensor histidine kinase/response regulator CckA
MLNPKNENRSHYTVSSSETGILGKGIARRCKKDGKGNGAILLVDDEQMILDIGRDLLEVLGYDVLLAKNGREAIKLYKKNKEKISLVILDMIMPDMGGGETYDALRGLNKNVKVILSSGYGVEGQASEILNRGCDYFIQKPFGINELLQSIRLTLENK